MRLLVISREMAALRPLWSIAEANSWHLEATATGWEAMERVNYGVAPHLVILDLPPRDRDSLHVLRWLRRFRPELPILVLCHAGDAYKKNDAIRLGADDVLIRPFPDEQLEFAIHLHCRNSKYPKRASAESTESLGENGLFVTASPLMRQLRAQAELLAQIDVPVLIIGEHGSGKTTVARLIHRRSVRSGFAFRTIQCASLTESLLTGELCRTQDSASGAIGDRALVKVDISAKDVVLLDEITELPSGLQAILLARLEAGQHLQPEGEGALNDGVRILLSTSTNIERALADGTLREDLYYRLSSFTVHVPPLRRRQEEIRPLLKHFMRKLSDYYGLPARNFSEAVLTRCENYSWPGNLTELEAFVKRYLVAGDSDAVVDDIESQKPEHSPGNPEPAAAAASNSTFNRDQEPTPNPTPLKSLVNSLKYETERNAIGLALERTGWNRKAAARLLGVSYRTLLYKIDQYQMNEGESFVSALSGFQHSPSGPGHKNKAS